MKKCLKMLGTILTVLLFTLSVLLLRSGSWMLNTWAHLTMEELIFHLKAPLQGTSEDLLFHYFTTCILAAAGMGLLLSLVFFILHRLLKSRKSKKLYHLAHGVTIALSFCIIGFSIYHVWTSLELSDYVEAQASYSTFIDEHYVNPTDTSLTFPEKKQNLIHIYLESVETTYTDHKYGGASSVDLIPELTMLSRVYEDFSGKSNQINGAVPLAGSTWTMGALFAQTSGLPLILPIDGNAMDGQPYFLPDLVTMGDLLKEEGYTQAFLIGSPAYFGGRELYFTDHGSYEIWDYNYFRDNGSIPSDYYVWWGFEDSYLIEFAKEKLTELSKQPAPFNLTMLTVDTHYEDGYVCADCKTYIKDNPYANVMRCSSNQIHELIAWIQTQDFYDNTTIVLTGDHLTMDSDFCSSVPADYQRKVYTTYINADASAASETYRTYSTFDIFPTTLASLGVKIDGERLGLGTNLFSDVPTLCETYGTSYMNGELKKHSLFMEELTSDVLYANSTISVVPYKAMDSTLKVIVNEVNHTVEIVDIRCLVWTKENREDAKWYIQPHEDGLGCSFEVPFSDFDRGTKTYYVEVFAYGTDTMMYSLGCGELVR